MGQKVFIVSECGINANGDLLQAKHQINRSKHSGADAVKFQVYNTDELFKPDFKYYRDSKRGMFSLDEHGQLAEHAYMVGIEWFATPFHVWAVDFLESLGVKRYKIASRSVEDHSLLQAIAKTEKPVIMSTGMSDEHEVIEALKILNRQSVTLLYCVSKYPTKPEEFNFEYFKRLKENFKLDVGFSSHCPSIWPSIKAVALGATIVEQHTTMDRKLRGCDQSSSLEYLEFDKMVEIIREMEKVG